MTTTNIIVARKFYTGQTSGHKVSDAFTVAISFGKGQGAARGASNPRTQGVTVTKTGGLSVCDKLPVRSEVINEALA